MKSIIKNNYPDVSLRSIEVHGSKDLIQLMGKLSLDCRWALFELYINSV